jgi:hypothetical protein
MARIGTYTTDTDVSGSDKVLGTDTTNTTKNYTLNSIGEYFSKNNIVSVAGQVVFKFNTNFNDHGPGSFMIDSDGGGDGTNLTSVTTVIIHKQLSDTTDAEKLIKKVFDSTVKVFGVDSVNTFCNYDVVSVADHASLANTLQVTLTAPSGEGSLVSDDYYALASTAGGDKSYTHNQGSPSSTWNIEHNLGKKPSVTIVDSAENYVVGEIEYVDSNNVTLSFSSAFSGKAYLN